MKSIITCIKEAIINRELSNEDIYTKKYQIYYLEDTRKFYIEVENAEDLCKFVKTRHLELIKTEFSNNYIFIRPDRHNEEGFAWQTIEKWHNRCSIKKTGKYITSIEEFEYENWVKIIKDI